jgi:hypothetical protein
MILFSRLRVDGLVIASNAALALPTIGFPNAHLVIHARLMLPNWSWQAAASV